MHAFWPAAADGDDIIVYKDEDRREMLRAVADAAAAGSAARQRPNLSLADYIAPRGSGVPDYLGMFAVTGGIGAEELVDAIRGGSRRLPRDHGEGAGRSPCRGVRDVAARAGRATTGVTRITRDRRRRTLHHEKHRGIRPAPGYPACPDHSGKFDLFQLLRR